MVQKIIHVSRVWEVLNIMSLSLVTVEMSACVMWIRWGHNLWLVQVLLTIQVTIFKSKLRLRSSMLEAICWLAWFHPVSVSGAADVLYRCTAHLSELALWALICFELLLSCFEKLLLVIGYKLVRNCRPTKL